MSQMMETEDHDEDTSSSESVRPCLTQTDDDGDDRTLLLQTGVSAGLRKRLAEIKRGMTECERSREDSSTSLNNSRQSPPRVIGDNVPRISARHQFEAIQERGFRVREKVASFKEGLDKNKGSLDEISTLSEDLTEFYEGEMHDVRSCAELLEMQSVLDALRTCEDDVLESALATCGQLTSHDVGATVAVDVGEAVARLTATRRKFRAKAGSVRGLGGRKITGPPALQIATKPPRPAVPSKKKQRQAGANKAAVIPEQDEDPHTADDDPTSIAVKVPSARLTLHSTKLCTKFKFFRKKNIFCY
jgi:hypothetical protein